MVSLFALMLACLVTSFVLKELFKHCSMPEVVGQIVAGILLGLPIFTFLFTPQTILTMDVLSKLGILFLLFLAGIEININKILSAAKDETLIAVFSAIVPFISGFLFLKFFGYTTIVSIIFGIAIAVTAEGTTVKTLMDMGKLNTKLGAIMLGAGAIDDIIEVVGLSLVTTLGISTSFAFYIFPLKLIAFAIFMWVAFKLLSKLVIWLEKKKTEIEFFAILMIFLVFLATLSELLGIGYLLGAIIAGFLLQFALRKTKNHRKTKVLDTIELITLGFVVPFFFINIGLHFRPEELFVNPLFLLLGLVIAVSGKIVGTMIVKPLTKLSLKQLYIIGWAMNSRGAVELIVALTASQLNLIPPEVFSLTVVIALVTTLSFPFILQYVIKKDPKIMD